MNSIYRDPHRVTILLIVLYALTTTQSPICNAANVTDLLDNQTPIVDLTLLDNASPVSKTSSSVQGNVTPKYLTPSLEGLWVVRLDSTQVSMVLYQSDAYLFGAASSSSPDIWNAVVMGSITDDAVDLTATYLQGSSPVATRLYGNYSSDTIEGSYFQTNAKGSMKSGELYATLINPETKLYKSVFDPSSIPLAYTTNQSANQSAVSDALDYNASNSNTVSNTVDTQKGETTDDSSNTSRYIDVHTMAHLVPEAVGVIPPGISMGGAGGMGFG